MPKQLLLIRGPDAPSYCEISRLDAFSAEHEREYRYVLSDIPIELQLLRVVAHGNIDMPKLAQKSLTGEASAAQIGARNVFFDDGAGFVTTKVYDRQKLLPGARIRGPAVIEQMDTTVLVHPGMNAEVDKYSNVIIETM